MLTNKQKADKLREAIALLMDVDCLQQAAIGESDVCFDNHIRIQDLIDDLTADVQLFDKGAI
jgi:hypothetical protein